MRLICPNCAAQYEVDPSMIPDGGRDVQCSSCGHTWFQRQEGAEEAIADEIGLTAPAPDTPPEIEEDTPPRPEASMPEDGPADDADDLAGDAGLPSRRRELDSTTRAILREEAEREAAARRRPASSLEVQPDLGLGSSAGAEQPRKRRNPIGRPALAEPEPEPEPAMDPASSRRDLLPDIEEINSTLTATSDRRSQRRHETDDDDAASSRGFRLGFSLMVALAVLLVLTYAFAPSLARSVPALEPVLADYVEQVNELRVVVDGWLQRATAALGRFG